ncbi:hypothetical protein BX666DRAFT_1147693 [Dichotomocladium elegans]|nr:hypothetical protein BX666DRAFT_1147693 [Dichotomocladium elegans]
MDGKMATRWRMVLVCPTCRSTYAIANEKKREGRGEQVREWYIDFKILGIMYVKKGIITVDDARHVHHVLSRTALRHSYIECV